MKVALFLDDRKFSGINFCDLENGNPGVGGTVYCIAVLAHELMKRGFKVAIIHYNKTNTLNVDICNIIIKDFNDLKKVELSWNWDCFVITNYGKNLECDAVLQVCRNVIIWVHNFVSVYELDFYSRNCNIKQVVFVGKQLRDTYVDHPVFYKSRVIYNFVYQNSGCNTDAKENIVTYTGNIIPAKGFHVLAKEWKKVLMRVPDAQLYVLGSGNLYDREVKMGRYQIASEEYETQFIPYITDAKGEILSSIHFMGILKQEKNDIYIKTKVGIVNPTARTEICSISALEMQSMGIPVISKAKYGMVDVIENGLSGRLIRREGALHREIANLLLDDEKSRKLGQGAIRYVEKKFSVNNSLSSWIDLLMEVKENRVCCQKAKKLDYPFNQYKWLRFLNSNLQQIKILKNIPSVAEIRECISEVVQKVKGISKR